MHDLLCSANGPTRPAEGDGAGARLPGWSSGTLGSLTKAPQYHLADSGLATAVRGVDADRLADPTTGDTGGLWETFVLGELLRQAAWEDSPPRLFHVRDRGGRHEVDILLEYRDGSIVGVEVKRTSSPSSSAFRGLAYLRDRLGPRFVQGVVLCSVPEPVPFGDRLTAAPIRTLWS